MGGGPLTVFVDPYRGEITGTRTPTQSQSTFSRRLHVFHVELLAGRVGRRIVGLVTAVALFLLVTGIVLWWPDKLIRNSHRRELEANQLRPPSRTRHRRGIDSCRHHVERARDSLRRALCAREVARPRAIGSATHPTSRTGGHVAAVVRRHRRFRARGAARRNASLDLTRRREDAGRRGDAVSRGPHAGRAKSRLHQPTHRRGTRGGEHAQRTDRHAARQSQALASYGRRVR